ncbi:phage virion morphogenesis protein [Enterobacter cloacae subsp. cloacae]|nr:phage virion morphogenesis protein [Enterobacter cloacae subsp. cloacae]
MGWSEFKPFDDRLNGLIVALSPAARHKLAGEIKELRKSQQQRIVAAPDSSPYQARESVSRSGLRLGGLSEAMFQKLRTSRYMKATGRENSAVVEFTGQCSVLRKSISRVKKTGQIHTVSIKGRVIQNAQLLGFSFG